MPLLTTQSAKGYGLNSYSVVDPAAFHSITTEIVGSGGASSVTFGSGGTLTQGYKHLQIRMVGRSNRSGSTGEYIKLTFNGDTSTSKYADIQLNNNAENSVSNNGFIRLNRFASSTTETDVFGAVICNIYDYTSTDFKKVITSHGGAIYDTTGGDTEVDGGIWDSTSAITSITLTVGGGTQFNQHTKFALYGIKG